jgi:hypothetical protein
VAERDTGALKDSMTPWSARSPGAAALSPQSGALQSSAGRMGWNAAAPESSIEQIIEVAMLPWNPATVRRSPRRNAHFPAAACGYDWRN